MHIGCVGAIGALHRLLKWPNQFELKLETQDFEMAGLVDEYGYDGLSSEIMNADTLAIDSMDLVPEQDAEKGAVLKSVREEEEEEETEEAEDKGGQDMHLDSEREEVPLLFLDKVDDLPDPGSSSDEASSDREPFEAGDFDTDGEAHDVVAMEPGIPQETKVVVDEEEDDSEEDMGDDITTEKQEELDDVLVDRSEMKDHDSLLEQEGSEEHEDAEEDMVDDDTTEEPEYEDDVAIVGQIETEQKLDHHETHDDHLMAEDTEVELENVLVMKKAVENDGGQGKGKKVSSYFQFASKTRAAVKDELSAAGKACTASAIAKILGERWRALNDVEKQSYSSIQHDEKPANEVSAILEKPSKSKSKSAGTRGGGNKSVSKEDAIMPDEGEAGDRNLVDILALPFPNTRVKRIIKVDPDVKLVTSDAVVLINHATALFVESLALASFNIMLRHKRKSVRAPDVVAAAKTTWQFRDCLGNDLEHLFEESDDNDNGRADDAAEDGSTGKKPQKQKTAKKQLPPPPGIRPITNFFKT